MVTLLGDILGGNIFPSRVMSIGSEPSSGVVVLVDNPLLVVVVVVDAAAV